MELVTGSIFLILAIVVAMGVLVATPCILQRARRYPVVDRFCDMLSCWWGLAWPPVHTPGPCPAPATVRNALPVTGYVPDEEAAEEACPICFGEYVAGEKITTLPCNHFFHVACINEWLKRDGTCPLCKYSLRPESTQSRAPRTNRSTELPIAQPPIEPSRTSTGQPILLATSNSVPAENAPPSDSPASSGSSSSRMESSLQGALSDRQPSSRSSMGGSEGMGATSADQAGVGSSSSSSSRCSSSLIKEAGDTAAVVAPGPISQRKGIAPRNAVAPPHLETIVELPSCGSMGKEPPAPNDADTQEQQQAMSALSVR